MGGFAGHTGSAYLAHSVNIAGEVDTLRDHLKKVADRAAEYAEAFNAAPEAYLAGLLHDIGKYGDAFQRRLRGEVRGIDHWSLGAWIALMRYRASGIAAALSIQGHHAGLKKASRDALKELDPARLSGNQSTDLVLSEKDVAVLFERIEGDGLELPPPEQIVDPIYKHSNGAKASGMLDVRMLFSALVDADFIETEAHFNAKKKGERAYREPGLSLKPDSLLAHLLAYIGELAEESTASPDVRAMRDDLLNACLSAAEYPHGLFTLTAPTGTGKTLSMLAFAMKHASQNNLNRIITVLPYLNIIEQTVGEYQKAFASVIAEEDMHKYVLEHHSLAGLGKDENTARQGIHEDEQNRHHQERLLAENWDAPVIITTSVQFLESLLSNRPSACRKLHRISNSVVLFDEIQTLPIGLVIPTLATLSRLAEKYNSTIVFATATQPAFSHLETHVRRYCSFGWSPKEIVPEELGLYQRARRNRIKWFEGAGHSLSWQDLAILLADDTCEQVLCIVNLKRHALALFNELVETGVPDIFHLSTNMCPAHRREVLREVCSRLKDRKPCRLVSTQCVEAGVDVDFPLVYRALGPMDSIAQAAGRCNRNGRLGFGEVVLFTPQDAEGRNIYPDGSYRQAAVITNSFLRTYDDQELDINSPHIFEEYYRELYDVAKPEARKKDLLDAIDLRDFEKVASNYRIIENNTINILVPYNPGIFTLLAEEARNNRLNAKWIARARPYAIGLFKPSADNPVSSYIEPVPIGKGAFSENWFVYLNENHYCPETGLNPPEGMECFIG
ncbi:MAG: CRISPR-associated helicase Cas3' [Actinomycetota bacterium]|nr:CRISPR-associated helicase Cas3' [Actinomycetota bacterium]